MKKMRNILLTLSAFSLCFIGGVSTLKASAQEAQSVDVNTVKLAMVEGAAIRYSRPTDDSAEAKEEAYKKNGIKFVVALPEADYLGLEALEGKTYTSVSYGVLVAPEDYGTLDPASVFGVGGEKKFDWSIWNEEKDVWEYTGDGTYTRITNVISEKMVWNEQKSRYEWSGSITNLKTANLDRKFQGVGYIAYTTEVEGSEVTKYIFTEDNSVRSMVQVAQLAIDSGAYVGIDELLTESYITPVSDQERTYTVEHYDEFGRLFATTEGKATIDDSIDVSGDYTEASASTEVRRRIVNGTFNAEDDRNVVSIDRVYADATYTLKKYYSNVTFAGTISTAADDSYGDTYQINYATETVKATFVYPAAATETNAWKVSGRWVIDGGEFLRRFDIYWTGSQLQFMLYDEAVYTAPAALATTLKNALAKNGLVTYFTINGKTLSWYFPDSNSSYRVISYTTDHAKFTDVTKTALGITTVGCGAGGALITYDKLSESADVADLGLTLSTTYNGSAQVTCSKTENKTTVATTPDVTVSGSTASVLVAQMKVSGLQSGEKFQLDLRAKVNGDYHSLACITYNGTNLTVGQRSASGKDAVSTMEGANATYAVQQLQDSDGWTVVIVRDGIDYQIWVDDNGTLTMINEYVDNSTGEYTAIGIGYSGTNPTSFVGDVLRVDWMLFANTTDIKGLFGL